MGKFESTAKEALAMLVLAERVGCVPQSVKKAPGGWARWYGGKWDSVESGEEQTAIQVLNSIEALADGKLTAVGVNPDSIEELEEKLRRLEREQKRANTSVC